MPAGPAELCERGVIVVLVLTVAFIRGKATVTPAAHGVLVNPKLVVALTVPTMEPSAGCEDELKLPCPGPGATNAAEGTVYIDM
jgi:hypothetical protein